MLAHLKTLLFDYPIFSWQQCFWRWYWCRWQRERPPPAHDTDYDTDGDDNQCVNKDPDDDDKDLLQLLVQLLVHLAHLHHCPGIPGHQLLNFGSQLVIARISWSEQSTSSGSLRWSLLQSFLSSQPQNSDPWVLHKIAIFYRLLISKCHKSW